MKRVITLWVAFCMTTMACLGASVIPTSNEAPAPLKASDLQVTVGSKGQTVDLKTLSSMSVADYEKLSGRKMHLIQRWEFRMAQKKLRRCINSDGTVNQKKASMLSREMDGTTGFHLGGFALGLILVPIGVLIAYLINDEKKSNRVKWAWIGAAVAILIYVLIL